MFADNPMFGRDVTAWMPPTPTPTLSPSRDPRSVAPKDDRSFGPTGRTAMQRLAGIFARGVAVAGPIVSVLGSGWPVSSAIGYALARWRGR